MRIIIAENYSELSSITAGAIITKIKHFSEHNERCTLGLCTGSSIVGTYELLTKAYDQSQISFAQVRAFNLDEYMGLGPNDTRSFAYFMKTSLVDNVDFAEAAWSIPDGLSDTPTKECMTYEDAIYQAGGIYLQILGIGKNGHIGFNEPGTGFDSATHVVDLHETTREQNAQYFDGKEHVPHQAITMGLSTICKAHEIILLASGESKAGALKAMIEGPITHLLPASILQFHPQISIIADTDALSELSPSTLNILST